VNGNPADDITDRLIERARDGMDGIGAELVARMREMLNVPDGGTPSRPVHSKPGEPPHYESRSYQQSWAHHTEVRGDTVRTAAGTPMMLGVWLEKGTGKMEPRPHASTLAEQFGGEVVTRIRDVFADAF
jgi:hypothetical protein